jgi:hypothetical protein
LPHQQQHQPQLTGQLNRLLDALHELARETVQTRQLVVTAPLLADDPVLGWAVGWLKSMAGLVKASAGSLRRTAHESPT